MSLGLVDCDFSDVTFPLSDFDDDELCPYFNKFIDAEGQYYPTVAVPDQLLEDVQGLKEEVLKFKPVPGDNPLIPYGDLRFRVTLAVESTESWYSCRRILHPLPRFSDMPGINPRVKQSLIEAGAPGKAGLILVTGPSGSGKTTLLSSLFREYAYIYGGRYVTCEDPPEFPLNGKHGDAGRISQLNIKKYGGLAGAMVECLRLGPSAIMPGEARKPEEVVEVLNAACNGHVVVTSAHANDPGSAIDRLVSLAQASIGLDSARNQLANGLAAIIHQTMVIDKVTRRRTYDVDYLFFGDNQGLRSAIRNGKTEQLKTEIHAQKIRGDTGLAILTPTRLQVGDRRKL